MIQTCILKITLATIWKRDKKRRDKDGPVQWLSSKFQKEKMTTWIKVVDVDMKRNRWDKKIFRQ